MLPFSVLSLKKTKIRFPLVPDDFSAGETTNRDDHFRIKPYFNFQDIQMIEKASLF
jgi:hypothetical protein